MKFHYIGKGAYLEGLPVPGKGELLDDAKLTPAQKILLEAAIGMKMYERSNPVDEAEAEKAVEPEVKAAPEVPTEPSSASAFEKATKVKKNDQPKTQD